MNSTECLHNDSVVYFAQRKSDGAIKIGTTIRLYERLPEVAKRHGDLEILGVIPGSYKEEKELHKLFSRLRIGITEFFEDDAPIREYIERFTSLDGVHRVAVKRYGNSLYTGMIKSPSYREAAIACDCCENTIRRAIKPSDFTPEAVAQMVLEKAETKEAQATVLIAQVQKMRTYAKELTEN